MNSRHLLIVDDDEELRRTLIEQLAHYREFEIVEAGTGAEALAAVRGGHFDLMLLDVGLPDMDGREAVALFDVIETVDREKLAAALRAEFDRVGKSLPCFIEVNIGGEAQKSGVAPADTRGFVELCRRTYGLDIVGLMCVPPAGLPPGPYFAQLAQLGREAGVAGLSMGMSGDFETAIAMGATQVRVGSALFGARPPAAIG
jgi:D-serine deaminase-like pyridoxal phosphate-dependent protein